MGDTTTATTEKKDELQAEATELEQDIKEAEGEAKAARKDGDDERATRLEASIAETKKELGEIKTLLKGLTERPFHPAPGDDEQQQQQEQQAGAEGGEQKQGQEQGQEQKQEQQTEGGDSKPRRKHWMFGDRWNQE